MTCRFRDLKPRLKKIEKHLRESKLIPNAIRLAKSSPTYYRCVGSYITNEGATLRRKVGSNKMLEIEYHNGWSESLVVRCGKTEVLNANRDDEERPVGYGSLSISADGLYVRQYSPGEWERDIVAMVGRIQKRKTVRNQRRDSEIDKEFIRGLAARLPIGA